MTQRHSKEECKPDTFSEIEKIDAPPETIAKVALFGGDKAIRECRRAQERKGKNE